MKYLVTGGAGFIGSNIVSELLKQGQQVVVLDNFATGKRENILPLMKNENLTMIEGDLRSFHIVRSAVKGVDHILEVDGRPGRYLYQDGQWVFEEGMFNSNESYDLRLEVAFKLYGAGKL